MFERGEKADLKRSEDVCLICANPRRPQEFLSKLQREIDSKVLRTGRYLWSLAKESEEAQREIHALGQLEDDRYMANKLYKWPLLIQLVDRKSTRLNSSHT